MEDIMPDSKRIAGLVGPTMVAMLVSEFPLVQPHLYDAQIPPVVYLSGVLMFVAGLFRQGAANTSTTVFMVLEGMLLVLAIIMTFQAYRRGAN
jgi:hypothetical protein